MQKSVTQKACVNACIGLIITICNFDMCHETICEIFTCKMWHHIAFAKYLPLKNNPLYSKVHSKSCSESIKIFVGRLCICIYVTRTYGVLNGEGKNNKNIFVAMHYRTWIQMKMFYEYFLTQKYGITIFFTCRNKRIYIIQIT